MGAEIGLFVLRVARWLCGRLGLAAEAVHGVEEFRKRDGDAFGIADGGFAFGAEGGGGEGHGDAVIAMGIDSGAAQLLYGASRPICGAFRLVCGARRGGGFPRGAALALLPSCEPFASCHKEAVGKLLDGRAHGGETGGESGDAVAFLHAQFLRVVNFNALLGERAEGGEHGKLVNHFGDLRAGNFAAFERRVGDRNVADELAITRSQIGDVNFRADGNQKIEHTAASGIESHVVQHERGVGQNERGGHEEDASGKIAGDD